MPYPDAAAAHWAPYGTRMQYLTGTLTNEDSNDVALQVGAYATLKVGKARVRATFLKEGGVATRVDATSLIFEPGERYDWIVEEGSQFVYLESEDGATTFQAWVWVSSPKV